MSKWCLNVGVLLGSALGVLVCSQPIAAQVIPDNTLPAGERSQITGDANAQIDGGARRGGNLFHSFSQFSIPTGGSAYFNNAADVQNIFSRVTGDSVSEIDGLIRANGTANLFLLNPNGILFGPNASLNIGGSFIASTADSINFADQFQYSATNPQTAPLLTVSVPVGLQMGANPGQIEVQGNGYDLSVSPPLASPRIVRSVNPEGLRVPIGQSLVLIGGGININGGVLTAEQGRVELGSVRTGQVSFDDGLVLSYSGVKDFDNIHLSQQALADASGGGSIQVQGQQVSLTGGSLLFVENQGTQAGGSISVNAVQALELAGTSPNGGIRGGLDSQSVGVRSGADITVSTRQLTLRNGAQIAAISFSSGRSGDVTTRASDSIQVIGVSSINPSIVSGIGSSVFSSGAAGDVAVSTRQLTLLDGGSISSLTYGSGRGGDVKVNALDFIRLIGQSSLSVPGSITAVTLGTGDAGQVIVNAGRLVIQNGGAVASSTLATGRAGSLTINARESVEVSGRPVGPGLPSYVGSAASIVPESQQQAFGLPDRPSGSSGDLTINTPRLSISNGAIVTVNNEGTGNAGTLRVNANSISLDRGGTITAATTSGEGGNLDLNVQDVLLLRNNSQITTSAGGNGNGGNIRLDAGAIAAVPPENSDISADSINARGGNILVNASGIFGIQPRPQDTPLSDITATGATSALSGAIDVTTIGPDPTAGLLSLSTGLEDSSQLIGHGCFADEGNSFIISGRGGLPPTPEQQLDEDVRWSDRRRLVVTGGGGHRDTETRRRGESVATSPRVSASPSPSLTPTSITEATEWQVSSAGEIILVANPPSPVSQNSLSYVTVCPEN
ncbi:filamentous hemagglutinin N-terminal domain-containing protein [Cyanobacteria bacterium FACHB-471]|nr:filamentous hemagglutinin N-terminal domain-containing protein [Cyanobacteria bacterium FACHB-471]